MDPDVRKRGGRNGRKRGTGRATSFLPRASRPAAASAAACSAAVGAGFSAGVAARRVRSAALGHGFDSGCFIVGVAVDVEAASPRADTGNGGGGGDAARRERVHVMGTGRKREGNKGGWGWGDGRGEPMCAVRGLEARGVPAHTRQQYLAAGAGVLCGGAHEGGADAGNGHGDGGAVRRDGTREREEGGGGTRGEDGHGEMGWGGSMCAVRVLRALPVPAHAAVEPHQPDLPHPALELLLQILHLLRKSTRSTPARSLCCTRLAVNLVYTESLARSAVGASASSIVCREVSVEEVEGEGEPEAETARSVRAVSGVPAQTTPDGSPTAASPPVAVSPPAALGVLTSNRHSLPVRDRSKHSRSTRPIRLNKFHATAGIARNSRMRSLTPLWVVVCVEQAEGEGGNGMESRMENGRDGEGGKKGGWKGGWEEDGKRERVWLVSTNSLVLSFFLLSLPIKLDALYHSPPPPRRTLFRPTHGRCSDARFHAKIAGLVAKAKARTYKMEGPGLLYSVACVAEADIVEYRRSARDAAAKERHCDAVNLKAGHTKNMRRRQSQYKRCDARGIQRHIWLCSYPVQRRYCVERLTHLNVLDGGGVRPIVECPGCGVHHHEFYTCPSIRGLSGLHQTITGVLASTGERTDGRVFFPPPPGAEDIYNIILSS
ncbi:hypothetical protein C8F04DRAFT_1184207 [Mycena alexandri]|uniref:Uncharacterized protein n=1 Tax=Mycena alexandri TaxID=1745969 RepID=A0AAD6SSR1_9AGAR|nr:hypothetical protein C8F04DRAFT_1184207 [Mycena alexandri]